MFKILLINADSSWLIKREDLSDLEQIVPPVGLMYIATYLKYKLKIRVEVKVISRIVDCISRQDLIDVLKEYKPDVVGIRGLNIYRQVFHQTAAITKQFKSDIMIVGGGPYVTMNLQDVAEDKNIDYFVVGEGEITFCELIEELLSDRDFSGVKGLAYRDGERLIINAPREFIEDLDSLPFPDYNLVSVDQYSRFMSYGYNRRKQAVMFSSRGCPYECIFCHNTFGKEYRTRNPSNVFQEIEILCKNFGFKDFYFVDDNFNLDYERSMKIFDFIIESGMKINIYLANGIRGDIVDRAFIDKMVKAGVIWVTFSVETASQRLQIFIKKFINIQKITENIHYACEKNIIVNCCVMVGFPTETIEEALETIEYLKQFKKIVIPMFFSVKYYPDTQIHDLALRHGVNAADIEHAYEETYHDVRHSGTPLIPKEAFRDLYFKFLNEVFLSKKRLVNAIEIQKIFLNNQEILDTYSIFFRKRIKDLDRDILRYAK